jgi:large subunit ribosomal protein L29
MKVKEIRELSLQELAVKIHDTHEELANLEFQHSLHQLDNSAKVRQVRRDLARMITIQHEAELGIAEKRRSKAAARE